MLAETPIENDAGADESAKRRREAEARVGTFLRDKWHLDSLLGVGGMGAVYEATHRNGMRGAVKVLDTTQGYSASARKRFLREARLANEVGHPGVVSVLDDDETKDGCAFLVMELLEGATLDQLAAQRGGVLPMLQATELGLRVLDVLAAAHARGIVHRDIKPENLFVTRDGEVKILDFGIAASLAPAMPSTLTQTGEVMGTPAFMSPEQARGRWSMVDGQSDLYSLGASLFTLVTGELLYRDVGTPAEMLAAAITRPAPSLAERIPGAPPELAHAIDGALRADKGERWADAAAMREALEAARDALLRPRVQTGAPPAALRSKADVAPTLQRRHAHHPAGVLLAGVAWLIAGGLLLEASVSGAEATVAPSGAAEGSTASSTVERADASPQGHTGDLYDRRH